MRLKNLVKLLFILTAFSISVKSQVIENLAETPSSYSWLIRGEKETKEITNKAHSMASPEQAILLTQLAEIWWTTNNKKATALFEEATTLLEMSALNESLKDKKKKLQAARYLLKIVSKRNKDLSERLTNLVVSEVEKDQLEQEGTKQNAAAFMEAALYILDTDLSLSINLAQRAIQHGSTNDFTGYLIRLSLLDPRSADRLALEAVAAAKRANDISLLASLIGYSFPEKGSLDKAPPIISDTLKINLLNSLADISFSLAINNSTEGPSCEYVGNIITPLLGEYSRFLPARVSPLYTAIASCQERLKNSPLVKDSISKALDNNQMESIDDYINAAKKADKATKAVYLFKAASVAAQQNDYKRAIAIADDMDKTEKAVIGDHWETFRWQWAAYAAFSAYKRKDIISMQEILKNTPENIRSFGYVYLAKLLSGDKESNEKTKINTICRTQKSLLSEGSEGFVNLDSMRPDHEWLYWDAVNICAKCDPVTAIDILKAATKSINRFSERKEDKKVKSNPDPDDITEYYSPIILNASLIKQDYDAVQSAVSAIDIEAILIRLRLGLISSYLELYRAAKSEPKIEKKN